MVIERLKVLFLCTGNSCRSQMAEGWTRFLKGEAIEPYSAGIETHGLNADAVEVMAEVGVDIASHKSKLVDELAAIRFDYVITVCSHAHESCPLFPGEATIIHHGFPDPPLLAREVAGQGGDRQAELDCYRSVRDEIRLFVESLPDSL